MDAATILAWTIADVATDDGMRRRLTAHSEASK
jgi:hypothetical protein